MPIFEYQCCDCKTKHEVLHKSSTNIEEVVCPECQSKNQKKLLSSFSSSMGSSSGYSGGDSSATGSCSVQTGGCASGMCGLN